MKRILLLFLLLLPAICWGQRVIDLDLPSKLPGLELNGTLDFTGTMDYGIDFSLATITTADIRFQNSATMDNSDANTLSIDVNSVEAVRFVESTTTQALFGDGTQFLPSNSFISDPNTGWYKKATDQIRIVAGGIPAIDIEESSNIQIIIDANNTGTVSEPALALGSDKNTGFYKSAAADVISIGAGGKEGIRVDGLLGGIEIYMRDTIIFDNGAYLSNEETDTFKVTETVTKFEGDVHITGDLTKNAAGGLTYISTAGTQTIGTGGTFEKLYEGAMAYTGAHLYGFTESNGRLTYTGTKTKHFTIMSHTTIESDEAAALVQVRLAKDGTTIAGTNTQHDYTAVDTDADLSFSWLMELSTNEYLEIYGTSDTNGDTFVVHNLTLTVVEHSIWLVVLLLLPNIIINLFRKREDEFKIAA